MTKLSDTKLILAFEIDDPPKTSRVAIVIGNHDGRIERLEIQYNQWTFIKRGEWLHDERHALSCILLANLKI